MEELELIWRRSRKIALALPVLILVGFGTGNLTNRALAIPEGTEVYRPRDPRTRMRLEALGVAMERMRGEGNRTAEYVRVYRQHVQPVERVLVRRGMSEETARKIAWPLVEQTYRNQLDIATVLSVIYVESNGEPTATSSVGARGLMQVMPLWAGYWRACGDDLYEIEDNICNGTSILAYYMDRANGDERRALLGYNGCVRGTVTPRCHTYPDKVAGLRRQIARELMQNRPRPVARASMSATTAP
jgi:hypothetical protein